MTHLPLTLGDHTTALGPVTFTRIGKGGKWAFDADGCPWSVATGVHGKHFKNPRWDITGRVEPARDAYIDRAALGAWIAKTVGRGTMISFAPEFHADAVRMIEAAPIEADLARVTAERDEAVALVRDYRGAMNYEEWGDWRTAFLDQIGVKP